MRQHWMKKKKTTWACNDLQKTRRLKCRRGGRRKKTKNILKEDLSRVKYEREGFKTESTER